MLELKDDPHLLGHFSDNEMPLRPDMLDRYLELEKTDEGNMAAVAWLKAKGIEPASITDEIRDVFVEYAVEKYFSTILLLVRSLQTETVTSAARSQAD
jgi:hypothetical protein